ncbi:pep-cterm sorting domain-containing protein [Anaeramoeba ignava]|uniref:Pep-cterm sorting domain-containing protein n=1 Tax=Anaeramoeba ignava TaxID=1746090 RepID=A0A9Q0R5X2_ANAIG|nr:pep-cterm sorting domain-containing protein [Anaeramoeba ignava]
MNLNHLLDFSYQFIYQNFTKFIKTSFFLELEENHLNSILSNDILLTNEFELFQSIIKWGKHKLNINQEKENEEEEQLKKQISNIIDKIRFIDFSKEELEDTLKQDLIPNQISQKLIQFQKLQEDEKELDKFIQNENLFIFKTRFKFKSIIIEEIKHFKKLKEWINDNEFFYKMRLGFSAKKDGFDSQKWHSICDNKGKTLIIIKTKDNYIFGGFTQIGFTNDKSKWKENDRRYNNGFIPDKNAFIFSLRNDKNDRKPEKFTIKKEFSQYAIYFHFLRGPNFGAGSDFYLKQDLQTGCSNFGHTYNTPNGIELFSNEAKNYLAGSFNQWFVDEVETFFI